MKGGCVWVTHISNISLHKYTRMARGQDGVEVKSMIMIDLVLVKKDMGYERNGMRPIRSPCCTV